eukprot:scaffold43796_cov160-Amphora_coffeaeformis.AAC.1
MFFAFVTPQRRTGGIFESRSSVTWENVRYSFSVATTTNQCCSQKNNNKPVLFSEKQQKQQQQQQQQDESDVMGCLGSLGLLLLPRMTAATNKDKYEDCIAAKMPFCEETFPPEDCDTKVAEWCATKKEDCAAEKKAWCTEKYPTLGETQCEAKAAV